MNRFASKLFLRAFSCPDELRSSPQLYMLTSDLIYQSDLFGVVTAPGGITTDFASIPRIAWTYLSPEDPCILYPSVIHDYLYQVNGKLPDRTLSREDCDNLLAEMMAVCGARWGQKKVVLQVVRLFGASHWILP